MPAETVTWGRAKGPSPVVSGGKAAAGAVAGIPPLITWSLVTVGAWLIYVAIRGLSPLNELSAALTGKESAKPNAVGVGVGTPSLDVQADPVAPDPVASRASSSVKAPTLVSIGQGGHKLAPATAAAFTAWQGAFGRQIPITDSYRDYATQAAAHASDPHRFGSPDTSRHVKGQAVDVNLQALGAAPENQVWQALYASAVATGWCNPRGPYKGDHFEPWHFSNPGCG